MCGIVAVLRRPALRVTPDGGDLLASLERVHRLLSSGTGALRAAADDIGRVDASLRGIPGVTLLVSSPSTAAALGTRVRALEVRLDELEAVIDARPPVDGAGLEEINAALVACRDGLWAIGHDRLRTAAAVAALAGPDAGPAALAAYASIQLALAALDRLEVRGRDSAGLHILVTRHGLEAERSQCTEVRDRLADGLLRGGALRDLGVSSLAFVYKTAAEIGRLGDNVAALRQTVAADTVLRAALRGAHAEATVLGHTRWASVGAVSEANAHPVSSEEVDGTVGPYWAAVLNGDVDNHLELREDACLRIAREITTDAKVVPVLVSRLMIEGAQADEAFLRSVATFQGSVAIAANGAQTADRLHLALRGSGQALYIGLAEDAFLVASEPYGLVEEASSYVRMDGDVTGGQIIVLDRLGAGSCDGIRRLAYDGTEIPVLGGEVRQAEVTTRDIDRMGFPHFLLKEITEAPASFRKTLRGRIFESDGMLRVRLGSEALPDQIREALAAGQIRRMIVIGQGTAAVAARSVATSLKRMVHASAAAAIGIEATLATELSGFGLADDMSDTLVIAVSQSGTTTDTNRTVDLVRGRGAWVIAVVNRRNSDLVQKSHGVVYNSDGRDVEMAVPSTKAFYAQVAAGHLLAVAVADAMGSLDARQADRLLRALGALPDAMETVLARRPLIADAAHLVLRRRYWAVVGSGPNYVAAEEVRIKLSELCYKSISCDSTEDKKHIDLSSEPLILVCAAGLTGPNAIDVAKEIAIYRAHKAAPIVIASDGDGGMTTAALAAAAAVIRVPAVHPDLDFVLSAMAGHIFGYEAARAIDAQATPLRTARMIVASVADEHRSSGPLGQELFLEALRERLWPVAKRLGAALACGEYDGHLSAGAAVRLAAALRRAEQSVSSGLGEAEPGPQGTSEGLVDDLHEALAASIEELTRPIDAIKHQAKTVTVGTSRSESELLGAPLVAAVQRIGIRRDRLAYRTLRTLAALGPAVVEVTGFTRYQVGRSDLTGAVVSVVDQGGSARGLRSRTENDPTLRGTKHRAVAQRDVIVAVGRGDARPVVIVPELKGREVVGLGLLHVRLADRLDAAVARGVLTGYGRPDRLAAIVDAVNELNPSFDDRVLGTISVAELLTSPIQILAGHWSCQSEGPDPLRQGVRSES